MQSLTQRQRHVRTLDLVLVALSAPVWLPLMTIVGLLVLISSGRPIFFTQQRVGQGRRQFDIIKFRTMFTGPNPVIPDGSRITPIGGLLRRSSLDELPQLLNVIMGDMSLVGPRPMLPSHGRRLGRGDSLRFVVRPGMTGLAQVNGRNAITWEQRIRFDQMWVERISVPTAIRVLGQTARVVISGYGINGHDDTDPIIAEEPVTPAGPTLNLDELSAHPARFDRWAA